MYTDILRRFLILEMFVVATLCCNCIKRTPMENFKRHGYALYVKGAGYTFSGPWPTFRVTVVKAYKGDTGKLYQHYQINIKVRMPKDCYINILKGKYYLIFGNYQHRTVIESNACAGNMEWKNTTEEFRQFLLNYYLENA